MAIPKAKRNAPEAAASPDGSAAPRASPTASPSGMLCTVIAASIFPCVVIPPDPPLSRSAAASVSTISAPPAAMPTAAGKNDMLPQPSDSDCSIAGIMSDHTDAATIIPDAKPLNAADAFFPAPRRPVKNTAAAPAAVERNIIVSAPTVSPTDICSSLARHGVSAVISLYACRAARDTNFSLNT